MLKSITTNFSKLVQKITHKNRLTSTQVEEGIREIRIALIEAEVNIKVIKKFIEKVKQEATNQKIIENVKAGDMLIKIVHDTLVETLGKIQKSELNLSEPTQISSIILSGLQGSGKTTTLAKLANRYKGKRSILTVSLDLNRPAANEQLKVLSQQVGVKFFDRSDEKDIKKIIKNTFDYAKKYVHNLIFFDTAGRLQVDLKSLQELKKIWDLIQPNENLLVIDSMMGQQVLEVANQFKKEVPLDGLIFTKFDSDNRGGAVLSVKEIVNAPIKFIGIGEKINQLDTFDSNRIADRILGMGDIVGLVEKAQEVVEKKEAEKMAEKLKANKFDLEDYLQQLRSIKKMGSFSSIFSMIPGASNKINPENIDEKEMKFTEVIILSMTPFERKEFNIINNSNSRKLRVAKGSGTDLLKVNKVLKKFLEMKKMMKNFNNKNKMKKLLGKMGLDAGEIEKLNQKLTKR